jgi:2-hydroxychromene-2-carboxylate isomerase
MKPIEHWYEFGSTYSYLSVMRIEAVAGAAGAQVVWKPFLLGPIFAGQGWNDSPFNIYPAKGQYMWRDLERLCEDYAIPLRRPSVFPRNGLLAARVAVVAGGDDWCPAFTRAVFTANFAEDRDISDGAVLSDIIADLGRDPSATIEMAQSAEIKAHLRAQTDEAKRRGIFGAPSFTVGDELFWGNDRLGTAIAWSMGLGD